VLSKLGFLFSSCDKTIATAQLKDVLNGNKYQKGVFQ
jgi:hypothetical protein